MERSGPDDARDDAWDDESYPPAPLPPHERAWRHPSELAQSEWVRTEPPVAVGRGLLVTTGAIGSALGVAVLYLMLPTGAGGPTASPTATSSIAALRPSASTTMVVDRDVRAGDDTPGAGPPGADVVWLDSPGLTLPVLDVPSTVLVMTAPERQQQPLSVAVSIEGAPYVVTTANALSALDPAVDGVSLLGPDQDDEATPLDASLVSIDGDLAYLTPSSQIEVVSFATTSTARPGQPVTVLGDEPAEVAYVADAPVTDLDAATIVEGTPVIDEQGALVALCTVTIDADGATVDFVPVVAPADLPADTVPTSAPTDAATSDTAPPTTDPATTNATTTTTTPAPVASGAPNGTATSTTGAPGGSTVGATSPATPASTGGSSTPAAGSSPSGSSPSGSTPTTASSPWIGLGFDGAPATAPLTITRIAAGSPAFSAGVLVGERLVAIDGVAVDTVDAAAALLRTRQPGDTVKLTVAVRSSATSSTVPSGSTPTTGSTATTTTSAPITTSANTSPTGAGTTGTRVVSVVLGVAAPSV